jgi:TonB family protein
MEVRMTAPRLAALLILIACVSFSSAQIRAQRVRVSAGVETGLLQSKVDPVYPPLARQARIQGQVILQVIISKTGDVENVQLVSGHPMLAPAAIEAVKQWKYRPYLLNGEPVIVETQVQVNFALSDNPPAQGVAGDQPGGIAPGQGGVIGSIVSSTPGDTNRDAVPQRVRISSGVAQGLLEHKVKPVYPPDARDQRIQGVVTLQAIIDKEGNVANLQLISGHPLLAPSAIEAVKQWKYRPYLLNGNPLEVDTQIQVNFTLVP